MNKKILRIIGIILIPIMYIVFFLATKYISFINFSYDLLFFATLGFAYVSLHFFLDIKKMYNWIFNYRYLIGGIIFVILVIGGYHGSSIKMWNRYVEPEIAIKNSNTILGFPKGIRSDEWLVGTPFNLSQTLESISLSETNNLINAKETKVSFYPRLIVKDLGILMHPEHWGYLFLPVENAFSFNWYSLHFAAFFVALELLMLITKKNKLYSVLGAFLLVLSSASLWWNNNTFILYGGLAILIINKFINTKDIKLRVLLSTILGWIAACYLSIMYPAWMIPYAYLFVLIFIWLLIENKDKIKSKDLLYLIPTIIVCFGLFIPFYLNSNDVYEVVSNTVYPGERTSYGGNGNWKLLFNYVNTIYYPYIQAIENPCELSQFLSLFPLPIIMGLYQLIKNKKQKKKKDWLLILLCFYAVFLTIWCIVPLPQFISKITLLTMSTADRGQYIVGYTCIFILIHLMCKYENNSKEKKINRRNILTLLVSVISLSIIIYLSYLCINGWFSGAINIFMCIISFLVFFPVFYLFIKNKKQTNFILTMLLLATNVISIFFIQPLDKGLGILYEKPFAKKIQAIVEEEPNAKFLNVNGFFAIQNYILVNGGKSINSTNFVPNLELWHKIDPNKKYEDVYNRYAHVSILLIDSETSFELLREDSMLINLNYSDICITEANYLVSTFSLEDKKEYYTEVYNENDMYIYKTTCEN